MKKTIITSLSALLIGASVQVLGAAAFPSDEVLNKTSALSGTAYLDSYLVSDTESTYSGDVAALLYFGSATTTTTVNGTNLANFLNDIWIKADASSTADRTAGALTINGNAAAKTVDGSVNILLDSYNYTAGTTAINGSSTTASDTNRVKGGINVTLKDSRITSTVSGGAAKVDNGDINITLDNTKAFAVTTPAAAANYASAQLTTGQAVVGTTSTLVNGDVNVDVKNDSWTGAVTGANGATTNVTGNVNVKISDSKALTERYDYKEDVSDYKLTETGAAIIGSNGTVNGNVKVEVSNSTTGAITGGATVNNGGVNITVSNSSVTKTLNEYTDGTASALTAADITGATVFVDKGTVINVNNSTVGNVLGGAATVKSGGVNIALDKAKLFNNIATYYSVTATTGEVTDDVNFSAKDSTYSAFYATNAAAKSNSIDGDVNVNLTGNTEFKGAQYFGGYTSNNVASKSTISGDVTVNIDSSVSGNAASIYLGAVQASAANGSATLEGSSTLNLIGVDGENNFSNYTGTIYGAYKNSEGETKNANVNFVGYKGDFKGVLGLNTSNLGTVNLDKNSNVRFVKTAAAASTSNNYNIKKLNLDSDLNVYLENTSATATHATSLYLTTGATANAGGTAITGSGDIIFDANRTINTLFIKNNDLSAWSGAFVVNGGTLNLTSTEGLYTVANNISGNGLVTSAATGLSLTGDLRNFSGSFGTGNIYLDGKLAGTINHTTGTLYINGIASSDTLILNQTAGTTYVNNDTIRNITASAGTTYLSYGKEISGDRTYNLSGNSAYDVFSNSTIDGNLKINVSGERSANFTGFTASTVNGNLDINVSGTTGTVRGINAGSNINGDYSISLANRNAGDFRAMTSTVSAPTTVNGNLNVSIVDSTFTSHGLIYGANANITKDLNVYLENVKNTGSVGVITSENERNPIATQVGGNLNFTLNGGEIGSLRLGVNHDGVAALTQYGTIAGDINAVLGGHKDESGNYHASSIATTVGKNSDGESILFTGGRHGTVNGDVNGVIVSGTYEGIIAMGPNSSTVGGSTNLTILDGTFNGAIHVGSHHLGSSTSSGIVEGDANLLVMGGTFNKDINVGAVTSFLLRTNYVRGDAIATFTGDLSKVSFAKGVNVNAASADGSKIFNFTNANGSFSANIKGFGAVNVNNSNLVGDINLVNSGNVFINGESSLEGSFVGAKVVTINEASTLSLLVTTNNQLGESVVNNGTLSLTAKDNNTGEVIQLSIATNGVSGSGEVKVHGGTFDKETSIFSIGLKGNLVMNTDPAKPIEVSSSTNAIVAVASTNASFTPAVVTMSFDVDSLKGETVTVNKVTDVRMDSWADINKITEAPVSVLAAFEFDVTQDLVQGELGVVLSFWVGANQDVANLVAFHKEDNGVWESYVSDITYDGEYAYVTVNGFSSYAIGAVPEPATYAAIFGAIALALVAYKRRNRK